MPSDVLSENSMNEDNINKGIGLVCAVSAIVPVIVSTLAAFAENAQTMDLKSAAFLALSAGFTSFIIAKAVATAGEYNKDNEDNKGKQFLQNLGAMLNVQTAAKVGCVVLGGSLLPQSYDLLQQFVPNYLPLLDDAAAKVPLSLVGAVGGGIFAKKMMKPSPPANKL